MTAENTNATLNTSTTTVIVIPTTNTFNDSVESFNNNVTSNNLLPNISVLSDNNTTLNNGEDDSGSEVSLSIENNNDNNNNNNNSNNTITTNQMSLGFARNMEANRRNMEANRRNTEANRRRATYRQQYINLRDGTFNNNVINQTNNDISMVSTIGTIAEQDNESDLEDTTSFLDEQIVLEEQLTNFSNNDLNVTTNHDNNQGMEFNRANLQESESTEEDEATVETSIASKKETVTINTVATKIPKKVGRKKDTPKQFEEKYMLSIYEHKMQFGFYDIILLGDEEDDFTYSDESFPIKNKDIVIDEPSKKTCVSCFKEINIAHEFCVIYTGCPTMKHPYCHTCFHRHCEKVFDFKDITKGPERLFQFGKCTLCKDKCNENGEWRNAKYHTASKRWKIGKILPDGQNIIGVHQRMWELNKQIKKKEKKHQYNNYIISGKLYVALMKQIGIVDPIMEQAFPISDSQKESVLKAYETQNEDTFTCKLCKFYIVILITQSPKQNN
jgi:hypothetical protein